MDSANTCSVSPLKGKMLSKLWAELPNFKVENGKAIHTAVS
jgi:hypothetical protein